SDFGLSISPGIGFGGSDLRRVVAELSSHLGQRTGKASAMMRLVTGFAVVGSMLTFLPMPVSSAARNTAPTMFPPAGPNQLEPHMFLNCSKADGHCDFSAGADMPHPTA